MNYFSQLNERDIWLISQNKPTLIVNDFAVYGIPKTISYSILLGRGVFKWLAVRRDLIKLKNVWKSRITTAIEKIRNSKQNRNREKLAYWRGYLKAYEETRAEIRALCHSQRFRAPDFDEKAQLFLESLNQGNEN